MTRRLVIAPEAERDLKEAYSWYEQHRRRLGGDFLLAAEAVFAAIQRRPESFPLVFDQARRAILRRFPYGVLFIIDEKMVMVLAVLHARRGPRAWKKRVGRRKR